MIVVPWLLIAEQGMTRLRDEVGLETSSHGLNAVIATPKLAHSALINVLLTNHYAALADESVASVPGLPASPATPSLTEAETLGLRDLERRINALLPPEYQGRYEEVRPQSMGTAGLKYDSDGKVAWDEILDQFLRPGPRGRPTPSRDVAGGSECRRSGG